MRGTFRQLPLNWGRFAAENVTHSGVNSRVGPPNGGLGLPEGAACQNRTDDLLITSEMLYRLS